MSSVFSSALIVAIAAGLFLCVRRPVAGLLLLVGVTPFYTLLREASSGSPIFFIWPHALLLALVLMMAERELAVRLMARGVRRPEARIRLLVIVAVMAAALLLETESRLISRFVTDSGLTTMGSVFVSRSFTTITVAAILLLAVLIAFFPFMVRRRMGAAGAGDVIVAAFLVFGLGTIAVTTASSGILFNGLEGFRYYFFGALIYLPARYFLSDARHDRQFVFVVSLAALAGAAQILLESALLNSFGVAPQELPWVGHLSRQFGYGPERDRLFFSGRYVPTGLMYMHHMSGLFILLGFALQIPPLLSAATRRQAAFPLLVVAAAVIATPWTSRTVLLLLLASYPLAALAVRVSWARGLFGGAALLAGIFVASQFLIPGARYDVKGDLAYLTGRAFPNLVNAVKVDLEEITGRNLGAVGPNVAAIPDQLAGWSATASHTVRVLAQQPGGTTVAQLKSAGEGVDYRYRVPRWMLVQGSPLIAQAVLRPLGAAQVDLQIWDGDTLTASVHHRHPDLWRVHSVQSDVAKSSDGLLVEIDLSRDSVTEIADVTLVSPVGTLTVLGPEAPRFMPSGWQASAPHSLRLVPQQGQEEGKYLIELQSKATSVDFDYRIPDALGSPGRRLVAKASIRPRGAAEVDFQIVDGDRVFESVRHRHPDAWREMALDHRVGPSRRPLGVRISVSKGSIVEIGDVTLETPGATRVALGRLGGPESTSPPQSATASLPTVKRPDEEPPVVAAPPPTQAAPVASQEPKPVPVVPADTKSGDRGWPRLRQWLSTPAMRVAFGRGAEFGAWNQVFFQTPAESFASASYSDTKYLEFAQQFGILGLALLVAMAVVSLSQSFMLVLGTRDRERRAVAAGIFLLLFIAFASLLHLPSVFRVGFSSAVFVSMAIVQRLRIASRASIDPLPDRTAP